MWGVTIKLMGDPLSNPERTCREMQQCLQIATEKDAAASMHQPKTRMAGSDDMPELHGRLLF